MICARLVSLALHLTPPPPCSSYLSHTELPAGHQAGSLLCAYTVLALGSAWSTTVPDEPLLIYFSTISMKHHSAVAASVHPPTPPPPPPPPPVFIVPNLRERALVKGYWRADTVVEKAAEADQMISKNKEVWAAARVTAKIMAQHVKGHCCHHHSAQDPSAHASSSMAMDSGTTSHWHYQLCDSWNQMSLQCHLLPSEWILHQPCFALLQLPL